jgi:DNA-binding transcriptional ArsR family regulator
MLEVAVIDRAEAAALALDPIKRRILAALRSPASAAAIAGRVGLSRQKVNYHLRALEEQKLVEVVEERLWGGIKERMLVATARSYVVSPAALGPLGADPVRAGDRLSASYLIALGARVVREVGALVRRARHQEKRLATLSFDLVIAFESPAARAAFTGDLQGALAKLAARYHHGGPGARPHRLLVASYPAPEA